MRYNDTVPYSAEAYDIMRDAIIAKYGEDSDPIDRQMYYLRWHSTQNVTIPSEPVYFYFDAYKPSSQILFPRVHFSRTISGSQLQAHPQSTNYKCLNGNPYTKTTLNLFPFGSFPIDLLNYSADGLSFDNIRVEYDIDLVTGHGTIQIGKSNSSDTDFDYVQYTTDTTIGVPIQLSSSSSNSYLFGERSKLAFESGKRNITYSNIGAGIQLAGGATTMVGGVMTGNGFGVANGMGQTTSAIAQLVSNSASKEALKESYALDKLQNAIPQVYYSGSNGSYSAFQQNWSISQEFIYCNLPDVSTQGYLVMDKNYNMAQASGYVKCVNYVNNVPASQIEKDAISNYMTSGVFIS